MSVTPLTPTGIAIQKLKAMVAASTIFQQLVGVSTAEAALPFVYVPRKRAARDQGDKPCAIIGPAVSSSLDPELIAGGAKNHFRLGGNLELMVIAEVGEYATEEDELYAFLNFAEGLWADVLDNAAHDDNLAIVGMPTVYGPAKSNDTKVADQKAQRPFYKILFNVQWRN